MTTFREFLEEHKARGASISFSAQSSDDSVDGYLLENSESSKLDRKIRTKQKGKEIDVFWREGAILPDAIVSL